MASARRIHLPDFVTTIKDIYDTEPDEGIILEIREWVDAGNLPFLWHGHTHTMPPDDAEIEYIGVVNLPAKASQNRENWNPCPCCSPYTPKFKRCMIAWFPKEKVIRIIGMGCFKTINRDGHELANKRLQQRKKQRQQVRFLISNLYKLPKYTEALEETLPIARAGDRFYRLLHLHLKKSPGFSSELKSGELMREETVHRTVFTRSNDVRVETHTERFLYSRISGYQILHSGRGDIFSVLEKCLASIKLLQIEINDPDFDVDSLSFSQLEAIVKRLRSVIKNVTSSIDKLRDHKKFLSPETISTIRTWGGREDTPLRCYIRIQGDNLLFGQSSHSTSQINIPDNFLEEIPTFPDFGDSNPSSDLNLHNFRKTG